LCLGIFGKHRRSILSEIIGWTQSVPPAVAGGLVISMRYSTDS
jgi:hypothetical protein